MKDKDRILGIDIIKFFACFFVVGVHFFKNSGFYTAKIVGNQIFLQLCVRWLFFICVPLFMITTGYLQNKKTLSKKFYMSIIPLLTSYLFISIICVIFRILYLKENIGILGGILSVLNFSADHYAWYVEMFIGLFLLIPFLNLIYNNLQSKKQKLFLLGVMVFLSSGTSLFGSFFFHGQILNISTDWWCNLYPITYYFIGAFIHEYQIKIRKSITAFLIGFLVLIESIMTQFIFTHDCHNNFNAREFDKYYCIYSMAIAVLFFLLFYQADIRTKPIRLVITTVARRTLDIYLFSFIFDQIYYPIFLRHFFKSQAQFGIYGFVIIPLVLLSSFLASWIKDLLFELIKKIPFFNHMKLGHKKLSNEN